VLASTGRAPVLGAYFYCVQTTAATTAVSAVAASTDAAATVNAAAVNAAVTDGPADGEQRN